MKIVTKKQQDELDAMAIKKLRFVARATLNNAVREGHITKNISPEYIDQAMNRAKDVFYADNVM